jgi:hypothetical protein
MSVEVPTLGQAELAAIGKVDGQCVKVDLSRMGSATFDSLMKTLLVRGRHGLTGIGLNLDLYAKTKEENQRAEDSKLETRTSKTRSARGSFSLGQSALARRKGLSTDIAGMIFKTLSQSDSVEFLGLRSIDFLSNDFQIIADSVSRSVSLRTLHFCNLPLGDANFAGICRALKKPSVVELRCRKCGLTDNSAESLHSLISCHVSVQGELQWHNSLSGRVPSPMVCLQCLDLRDNDFTSVTICAIGDSLLDLPLKLLDLRGNAGITGSVVASLAREMSSTTIRTGPSQPIKHGKRAKKPYASKIGQAARSNENRIVPKDDRKRTAIADCANREDVVEIEPGLTIVGSRARELAEYLAQLDRLMARTKMAVPSFFGRAVDGGSTKVPKKRFKKRSASAAGHRVRP